MKLTFKRGSTYASILLAISGLLGLISANIDSLSKNQLGQVISSSPIEYILDSESSSGVSIVGTWQKSSASAPFYGTGYLHDNYSGKGTKSVAFTPQLPEAGDYDIYVFYSPGGNRATNTPVTIQTVSGSKNVLLNQQKGGGFTLVGRFSIGSGSAGKVSIGNQSTGGNYVVIADAVKWVKVGGSSVVNQTTDINQTVSNIDVTNQTQAQTQTVSDSSLTIPTGLKASAITNNSVTLSWNPVPATELVGYRIYRNNVLIADLAKVNSLDITALIPGTQYSFQITAIYGTTKDESARSSSLGVKTNNLPTSTASNPRLENGKKIYEIFEGAVIPELGITYLSGSKSARTFASGDGSAFATYGAPGEDKQFILSYVGGVSSGGGEFDQSNIWYWDLSKLPTNLNITKAYFQFKSSGIYGAYVANGKEGVPIRTILDPQNTGPWEMPYRKFTTTGSGWYGAGWRAIISNPTNIYSSTKWSTLPKTAIYGTTGDLSSVLEPISAITPRISFPVSSGGLAISTDATELIKKIVSRQAPYNQYRGFYLDPTNLINPVVNASHPSKTMYVGMFNHFSVVPENRPKLVIEVGGTDTPPTTSTTLASPTGLSVTSKTTSSITLTWTRLADNAVTGYKVYTNQTVVGTINQTAIGVNPTFTISNLTPATAYSLSVQSFGTGELVSPVSSALVANTDSIAVSGGSVATKRFGDCSSCDVPGSMMDTSVSSQTGTLTSGSSVGLQHTASRIPLIYTNLSSLPAGTKIVKATLRLYRGSNYYLPDASSSKKDVIVSLRKIVDSSMWTEAQASYNQKATGMGWGTGGNLSTVLGASIGQIYVPNWLSAGYFSADITSAVQAWVDNPASNRGFALETSPLFHYNREYASRENSNPDLRPYIEVTYTGTPTSVPAQASNISVRHYRGQSFVTWKEVTTGKNETSYRIYRSSQPITSSNLSQAELVDQVYQGSSYLSDYSGLGARQPNLSSAGITLLPDSGLYVLPIKSGGTAYYAVTTVVEGKENRSVASGQNTSSSPLAEAVGVPDAFLFNSSGRYEGYVMWLGNMNPLDSSDQYGLHNRRSSPVFFSVVKPYDSNGVRLELNKNYPVNIHLHAAGGNYFNSQEGYSNSKYVDANRYGGFTLGLNDQERLIVKDKTGALVDLGSYLDSATYSYYAGWNSNYVPRLLGLSLPKTFQDHPKPFSQGHAVMYTEKTISFLTDWLAKYSPWKDYIPDNPEVYLDGGSLGGGGSFFYAMHNPDRVSGIKASLVRMDLTSSEGSSNLSSNLYGAKEDNITLPDGRLVYDYMDMKKYLSANPSLNYPPFRLSHGRLDNLITWTANDIPGIYRLANSLRLPLWAYWDNVGHEGITSSNFPEIINDPYNQVRDKNLPGFNFLTFSKNKSYPTFSDFSLNNNPGDGSTTSGDLYGGINRYPWYDSSAIVDSANYYSIPLYLLDAAPVSQATVTVTLRRFQSYKKSVGTSIPWRSLDSSGAQVQSGNIIVGTGGLITIPNLIITKQARTLVLGSGTPPIDPPTTTDTTPPAVPTGLTLSNLSSTGVTLNWTAVSATDLAGYRLYRNGIKLTDLAKVTSYSISGLTPATTYSFQISAVDTSGNESTKSGVVGVTTLAGTVITPSGNGSNYIIENSVKFPVVGSHRIFTLPEPTPPLPAVGVPFIDKDSGHKVTRITDVSQTVADPTNPKGYNGSIVAGFNNGYARWSNANSNGKYVVAFGSTPLAALYDLQTNTFIRLVKTKGGAKVGEPHGVRWDPSGISGTEYYLYYQDGNKLSRQDVRVGASSEEVIYDFGHPLLSNSDGDVSRNGRYWPFALTDTKKAGVFDRQTGRPLAGLIDNPDLSDVDVSPDGKWLQITGYNSTFYSIADLTAGTINPIPRPTNPDQGHGSWAYDENGQSVYVWISAATDYIVSFNPGTKEVRNIMYGAELGWSAYQGHIGRISDPKIRGWFLFGNYVSSSNSTIPGYNQLFMIELKPVVKTADHSQMVPISERPRIWRLGSKVLRWPNELGTAQYPAQAFASIDPNSTSIYWGSNWYGTDNLELYRMELPADWYSVLNSGVIPPPPPPTTTDTTPPAVPTGLTLSNLSSTGVTLNWTAVSATDLAGYRLYRNGIKLTDLAKVTSYSISGLTPATTYSFQISAVDTSGNESTKSGVVGVTTKPSVGPVDTTPPSIFINQLLLSQIESLKEKVSYLLQTIFPKAEAAEIPRYTATKSPVILKGSASDNISVARVDWQNSLGGSGQAVGTSTWTINNLALFSGDNVLTISAIDLSGNLNSTSLIIAYNPPVVVPPITPPTGGNGGGGGGGGGSSGGGTSSGGAVKVSKVVVNQGNPLVLNRLVTLSFASEFVGKNIQIASRADFSDAKTVSVSNSTLSWDVCPLNNCSFAIYYLYYKKVSDPLSAAESTGFIYLPPAIAKILNMGSIGVTSVSNTESLTPLSRSLWYGMNGADVRTLQVVLNRQGFVISPFGAGSPGYETNYFGNATKLAVIKFQQAKGIAPALGGVGPVTMAKINELISK